MQIAEQIKSKIAAVAQVESAKINLEHPEREEYGDYSSNIALVLKGGRALAEKIAAGIKPDEVIKKVEVAGGGFINIWLQTECLSRHMNGLIKEKFSGKTWLLEHTSPNPNKAMHLGHLRNNVFSMALGNIWECAGIKVIRDCVDNDRGIAIAKLMYGYLRFAKKDDEKQMRPDRFVDDLYVKASKAFEEDKEVERQVRQMVVDWEAEDPKTWELWKKVLSYSYQGQEMTLNRLGSKWDNVWHEHEHYKAGKRLVEEGLRKGIFKKLDDGAILSDLKDYGLPDTILMKSDGTALYITQDLALTKLKKEKFGPNKMFWVVGPEQSLALQQMFAICEQLGIGKLTDYTHLAYGYMSIKGQGKMASRLGNVLHIDELLDIAKEEIKKKITERKLAPDEMEQIAEKAGLGAVKYSILKVGRMQDMAFDIDESISFEGNSGPYLQYTYARCQSVLTKAGVIPSKIEGSLRSGRDDKSNSWDDRLNKEEMAILRWIYRFGEVVAEAAERYSPNLVCNFLYELAQRYNSFYNQHSILSADNIEAKNFRLALTAATGEVIKKGLNLLGIDAPERM